MAFLFDRLRLALAKLPIESLRHPPPLVTVLRLYGPVGQFGGLRGGMTVARYAEAIERAFGPPKLDAVALAVNCPGGSAVQSALLAARIRALADEKKVPVIAFAEDVAASGGYWLACAADEIYANDSSIVGSIGVIAASFGFTELIRRLGVRRRLYTAGERKSLLDPFRPEDPREVERLKALQGEIHANFQDWVRARRGDRLKAPEDELFSGEFWSGTRALELGLIDGLGDLRAVMRGRFGDKVRLRPVGVEEPWLRRNLGVAELPADSLVDGLVGAVEARALWGRYGL